MRLAAAVLISLALVQQASAQTSSISAQCSEEFTRLADPQSNTIEAVDAADLLGDEFVKGDGVLTRAEFMAACQTAHESGSSGMSTGESGTSSDDDNNGK